jgi:hypothetical protein
MHQSFPIFSGAALELTSVKDKVYIVEEIQQPDHKWQVWRFNKMRRWRTLCMEYRSTTRKHGKKWVLWAGCQVPRHPLRDLSRTANFVSRADNSRHRIRYQSYLGLSGMEYHYIVCSSTLLKRNRDAGYGEWMAFRFFVFFFFFFSLLFVGP